MKKKKPIYDGLMDSIDFWISIWYFTKFDNYVSYNPESKISFNDFERQYDEYSK